jgi:hypothetical protein
MFYGEKHIFIKLMWSISIIIAIVFCCIELRDQFNQYYKYEINTVIEYLSDQDRPFPTVTLCNTQLCGLYSFSFKTILNKLLMILS